MKKIFEIEFPDEIGEMLCINAYCENRDDRIKATEVTTWVRLADDQTTPQYTGDFLSAFDAQRAESNFTDVLYDFGVQVKKDLLKAGWRKVIMRI